MEIGIIGGGIIGLTTGVALAEAGYEVVIYTRKPIEKTTSWAAGAIVWPYGVEESPRVNAWFMKTMEVLKPLLKKEDNGVSQGDWRRFSVQNSIDIPPWLPLIPGARALREDECPHGFHSGLYVPLMIMAVDEYVPYLMKRFIKVRGEYVLREVLSPDELAADHDVLINATGVYARKFCGDETVHPARGQAVIVKNPGLRDLFAFNEEKFYCYPRGDQILLGGSFDVDQWDRTPIDAITQRILKRAAEVEPLLADPEIIDVRVGLRPMRDKVRLEREVLEDGTPLIHNYGHGGAGYTLSWGCAFEVLKIVESL